jgi:hypothetical protein
MSCCTQYCAAEEEFDNKVAERDLQRYRRRGPDAITRLMVAELRRWPLQGGQVLDVGGGIGVICAELADSDRVVCCYPDVEARVTTSASGRVPAILTKSPRKNWACDEETFIANRTPPEIGLLSEILPA